MNKRIQDIHSNVLAWMEEAASIIRGYSTDKLTIETKMDHKDLVTNMGKDIQEFFIKNIMEYYPNHQIVGEETSEHQVDEKGEKNVWVIDPIDGTANFVKQKDHFCILISYYENGTGKLGYIYDVMNKDLYYAIENEGAFRNDKKLSPPPDISLRDGFVSIDIRNWYGKECLESLAKESFDIRYFGCGGIDSIHVITGKFAAFAPSKSGPWDLAAQLVFAKELDLCVSKFDGTEVNYLDHGGWIISNKAAFDDLLSIVKKFNNR